VVPWQPDKAAIAASYAFALYFLAEFVAFLVHPGGNGLQEVLSNLPFLGFFAVYSLMVVDRGVLISAIERVAAVVAVIGALGAIFAPATVSARVELAAGNPGIAAVLAGILLAINCIALARRGQAYWRYAIAGIGGSIIILLLTGMRALWPCIVLLPVIALLNFKVDVVGKLNAKFGAILFAGIIGISAVASGTVMQRLEAVGSDLQEISTDNYASSLGLRVMMWQAGTEMIAEKPLFGYGPGNVKEKIREATDGRGIANVSFSHFHNAVINELVRAGLFGLVALIAMFLVPLYYVYSAPHDEYRSWSLAMIAGMQTTYLLSGMTGIMIGHDILDAVFIVTTALCLFLVRPAGSISEVGAHT
jgi:O-antigen ligase